MIERERAQIERRLNQLRDAGIACRSSCALAGELQNARREASIECGRRDGQRVLVEGCRQCPVDFGFIDAQPVFFNIAERLCNRRRVAAHQQKIGDGERARAGKPSDECGWALPGSGEIEFSDTCPRAVVTSSA